ncbi:sensor histidine kinase [Fervidibacillus halotolerans]|uniref:histidine kinase n=1 Tax=Fervidibacillus halotolerans TaxID=2980027 RepID=A0A9E8M0J7_9BACI|nr:ATP-binding protein [Fervidibacillus halotolerans]WAA12979.1 ATP-binding protein [Fervidibacillus halotolerans]
MKLHTKLFLSFTIVIILMALFQSLFIQNRVENNFGRYLDKNLNDSIELMKEKIVDYYKVTGTLEGIEKEIFPYSDLWKQGRRRMQGIESGRVEIFVTNAEQLVVASSTGLEIGKSAENLNGFKELIYADGEKIGEIIVQKNNLGFIDVEKQFIRSSNLAVIISGLLAAITAVGISIFISKKMVKPLNQLMKGIEKIIQGERNVRLHIDSRDEFSELGEAFNKMLEKLNKNEQIRKNLVLDVAHELRTPLAILQGKLESIQEGAIKADEKTILELSDEVYRLNRLVNDLQQLSLAEAGELPLHKRATDINELIKRICGNFQGLAEEKGISIEFKEPSVSIVAVLDPDRMTEVLVNLIGNALKWTPPSGKVTITAEKEKGMAKIAVSDTGPGIKKEHLEFIFDRFFKADKSRKREDAGTGLGLSIAKGFVEAHGGTIQAESEEGKGTTLTIMIPTEGASSSTF